MKKNDVIFYSSIIIMLIAALIMQILNFNLKTIYFNPVGTPSVEYIVVEKEVQVPVYTPQTFVRELEIQLGEMELENKALIEENELLKNTIKEYENKKVILNYSQEELNTLYKLVRAEAGPSSAQAQKNVVYVILNRINSKKFPNTILEVIYQKNPTQFSCTTSGSLAKAEVSQFTINNVQEALLDYEQSNKAQGALYFASNNGLSGRGEPLFIDEVGHKFYD